MPHYKCVEIENKRVSQYQTLYYDTKDMKLYNEHHNGHLNRYKIRHRTYVDSNLSFLEVKFKNNKGRKNNMSNNQPLKSKLNGCFESATSFFIKMKVKIIQKKKLMLTINTESRQSYIWAKCTPRNLYKWLLPCMIN